jgi:hypothetical protein
MKDGLKRSSVILIKVPKEETGKMRAKVTFKDTITKNVPVLMRYTILRFQ